MLVFVALATLGLLIARDFQALTSARWRIDPPRLLAGLLLQAATVGIAAWIWADIARELGAGRDLRRDLRSYALSVLARRLPGAIWHVVGRTAYYADVGLGRRLALWGSGVEAGLLLWSGGVVGLAFWPELAPYGAVLAMAALVIGPPILWRMLRLMPEASVRDQGQPPDPGPRLSRLYLWLAVDVAAWMIGCVGLYLLFSGLYPIGLDVFPRLVAAIVFSVVLAGLVSLVPGGLGLREVGMAALLQPAVSPGIAAVLAIASRLLVTVVDVAWSLSVLALLRSSRRDADGP